VDTPSDPRFTEADADIIKRKAKRLVGHYGYRTSDVEDIEQDLAMHVFPRTRLHQPEKGSREGFIGTIATNKLRNVIELRTAQKRNRQHDVRIDDLGEGVVNDGTVSQEHLDRQIDVREALRRMPKDLQEIALLRMEHSEKDLEDLLHLTRAQVRVRLDKVEKFLQDAGLDPKSED
jgi:hypothetical protein